MNRNKFYTALITGTMIMGNTLPVFAAVTEPQDVTQTETDAAAIKETVVTYTQASNYSVVIPKTIVLDGQTKASDYAVKVSGDISSDKQVSVAPQDALADIEGINFYMTDQATVGTKKADVQADVTQNSVIWSSAEVCNTDGTSKNGNVAAPTITAGNWKGTFTFNIALQDAE